jgi:alpha,alpha-trehalase
VLRRLVLMSDIADVQGGSAFERIHLAAMAGSVDLLQRCFTGLEFRAGRIVLAPLWPEELGRLAFPFRYRGHRLHLEINGRRAKVTSESEQSNAIDIECVGGSSGFCPDTPSNSPSRLAGDDPWPDCFESARSA